jgi:two-component system response regulator AtoC
MIGRSPIFQEAVRGIPAASGCDVNILICGETGTGKELIARAIHYQSVRHGKPFIPVNCGALPDHLFENELFGHVRGAYTDAQSAHNGLIGEAESGTLFLDEVDALSIAAQIKLLRFLQDREYRPLGCPKAHVANVRIIAATNAILAQRVEAQTFRADLYYRLRTFPIHLPPLRDRKEDIPLLVSHFLLLHSTMMNLPSRVMTAGAMEKLMHYGWPGNIRELESVIQQAMLVATTSTLHASDIDLPDHRHTACCESETLASHKSRAANESERNYILSVLVQHEGNVTQAARMAGKDRRTFQRLLRKHGIDRTAIRMSA